MTIGIIIGIWIGGVLLGMGIGGNLEKRRRKRYNQRKFVEKHLA